MACDVTISRHQLDGIQAMRGGAAIAVAALHATVMTRDFVGGVSDQAVKIASVGALGVDVFFVVSGFIILNSHIADRTGAAALKTYAIKRLTRIFPPYWLISIPLLVAYWLLPDISKGAPRDISLLSSLMLLPATGEPALVPAWSLIYELQFYLIFSLFFVSPRWLLSVVGVWTAACLTVMLPPFASLVTTPPIVAHLFASWNLEFVFGMAAAFTVRVVPVRRGKPMMLIGGALMAAVLASFDPLFWRILFALGAAIFLIGLVAQEVYFGVKVPRPLVHAGDASYAIYLIHNPIISITSRAFAAAGLQGSGLLCLTLSIIASVGAGLLFHHLLEKPSIRLARLLFPVTGRQPRYKPPMERAE